MGIADNIMKLNANTSNCIYVDTNNAISNKNESIIRIDFDATNYDTELEKLIKVICVLNNLSKTEAIVYNRLLLDYNELIDNNGFLTIPTRYVSNLQDRNVISSTSFYRGLRLLIDRKIVAVNVKYRYAYQIADEYNVLNVLKKAQINAQTSSNSTAAEYAKDDARPKFVVALYIF